MPHPIVNIADLDYFDWARGERFAARIGMIAPKLGAQKLGYNVTVVPPGKRAFPRHNHLVNEEMFFVLEGQGELRMGDQTHPIRPGDVIACPPGGPETAHQIINTSETTELRYLAVSTRLSPEICEYPDSAKTGITNESPGADGKPTVTRFIVRDQATFDDYWSGEDC